MYRRRRSQISPIALIIFLIGLGAFVVMLLTRQNPAPQTASEVTNPPQSTAPALTTTPGSAYDTEIVMTDLGVTAAVIPLYFGGPNNWDLEPLLDRVGHLEGTPELGQRGNIVMVAHVELKDGSAGPFARLQDMKVGDTIRVVQKTAQGPKRYFYEVTEIKDTDPSDINVMRNRGIDELTLITCRDWNQREQRYLGRVVIHAVARAG